MSEELSAFLKRHSSVPRVLKIYRAEMDYIYLRLSVLTSCFPIGAERPKRHVLGINCLNAVEYYIRPKDPATIEGGPQMYFYERHQLLDDRRLQGVPGGDGEVFTPPLKFQLLVLDQSYVIATRFEVEEIPPKESR